MIERLVTTLRALADLPPSAKPDEATARLAADCADALRLELDCPQQELSARQRQALRTLGDDLESPGDLRAIRQAASVACHALGIERQTRA